MNHTQPTSPSTVLAQPAIFTVYAWHPLEDGTRLLKTHLVAAHSSELAENLFRQINASLLEGAECFISTDFLLDHLNSFGACHAYSNTISRSEPLSEQDFKRWAKTLTTDQWEDGDVQPATIRPIQQNKAVEAASNSCLADAVR